MGKIIHAADLFCGAGGTSTGLRMAAEALGCDLKLTAVNHWETAIETHAANHPWAEHLCTSLEGLKPSTAVPGGKLDLLVASPECTHHSNARGGKPRCDQSRASAWHVLHWCQELYVRNLLIENVPEFAGWGPLDENGKPIKSMRGKTFHAFVNALRSLSYSVDWQVLNCADYGDATTRRRFFLMARRGRKRVAFPTPTNGRDSRADIFGQIVQPWRPAQDIIDWNNPGHSIFLTRDDVRASGLRIKRPLAENTLKRIAAGVERFWGEWADPFLVLLRGTGTTGNVDNPMPAITAGGTHVGLCQPFMVRFNDGGRVQSIDQPLSTLDTSNRIGLIKPLILPQDARGAVRTVDYGLPTITATGAHALIEPFVMATGQTGGSNRIRSAGEPLSTLVSKAEQCVVQPFVVKYYGTGRFTPMDQPIDTVTTDDRFGLVRPMVVDIGGQRYLIDILFRMLTPKELAAAHSFPNDYRFAGTNSDIVKQIGNSVPVRTANNLGLSLMAA